MVRKPKKSAPETLDERFMIRCSKTEREAWNAAAAADNRTTSQWLRTIANREAAR